MENAPKREQAKTPPHSFIDSDTTDAFLDLPRPRYQPHGRTISPERIQERLDEAAAGGRPLPKLPPPVEH